ncbi:MAG: 3-hydroxyacyl-CoA dehydrogenase NAD-binding domain-containing protein [Solirubrobacteraceae bacterium]
MDVVGVCGAGTMGAGIAQLAAGAGARTLVHDPTPGATERALEGVRERLGRSVERGRVTRAEANATAGRLEAVDGLERLAPCAVVIEAAPERLALKQELLAALEEVVAGDCVLATNTSSLLVTEIAATARRPERVVGMHFFNPAPRMRLVEVVAGERSGAVALAAVRALGEAMGKRVIDAADGPGFLVNRCNRPFHLEALRCLAEGLATPEQIDRIVRLGGSFKMGPFELMDLVGLDTSFAVQRSFFAQSFGEPRWRPAPLVGRMVAAGRLGRKSGEGFYAYPREAAPDPPPREEAGGDDRVVVAGHSPLAEGIARAAREAGWTVGPLGKADGETSELIVDCGATDGEPPVQGGHHVRLCDAAPLAALDPGGASAGFFALAPFETCGLVELTRRPTTSAAAAGAAERFFASLARRVEWVGDAPGLVLGRIVCQLVNEACFALGEGVGSADDIDAGMTLGLNHPRGPLEWADAIDPAEVLVVVAGLHAELGDDRYRPAPALVRAVRSRTPLRP